jgi:prepilin-type N-terminal cleavage/methylation domain-containing protein
VLRRWSRRAAGFTLLEIVITLAIIGVLVAALMPQVLGRMTQGQSASLLSTLTGLQEAATAHRGDVGRYPQKLRQLAVAPTAGTKDSCGRVIPGYALSEWAGPYVDRNITAAGIAMGGSVIADSLRRAPATYSEVGTLYIDVADVDQAVANQMETAMDGTIDYLNGSILWAQVGTTGRGTLSLASPVRGC